MAKNKFDVSFSQSEFIKYANREEKKGRFLDLFSKSKKRRYLEKMTTVNGVDYSVSKGYCYGFSQMFLAYSAIGKDEEYFNNIKELLTILNEAEPKNLTKLEKVKQKALKMHASSLLDHEMQKIILTQGIEMKSGMEADLLNKGFDFEINNKKFIDYMWESIDRNLIRYKVHYLGSDIHDQYLNYMYELQKIKIKRFYDALNKDLTYFETDVGHQLLSDPWFKSFYAKFSKRKVTLERDFTIDDANFFREMVSKSIQWENHIYQEQLNKQSGIKLNDYYHSYIERDSMREAVTLGQFIEKIDKHTQSSYQQLLFEFSSENHAMAISVKYAESSQSWEYTFFDSNIGIIKHETKKDFKEFIKGFVQEKSDYYKFTKADNGEYIITYSQFDVKNESKKTVDKLNLTDIKMTESVLLVEGQETVYLDSERKNKIKYKQIFLDSDIVKLKMVLNGKECIVYTDILDVSALSSTINENINSLSKISGGIFISQSNSQVYRVDENFDVKNFRDISIDLESKNHTNHNYSSINLNLKPLSRTEIIAATGMPESHQQAITQVANEENIIIGFRPIDLKSKSLIESGKYSSKGLAIKAKSADWGPHSGFIPILQNFAKPSGRKESDKYNQYVQKSIDEGHAIAVQLEITPSRMNELLQHNAIYIENELVNQEYNKVTAFIDDEEISFPLKKVTTDDGDVWQVYFFDNDQIKPFNVIGDPKTGKAMTADYDLFTVIFPFSELEHYVKVTEMPSWSEWKESVIYDDLTTQQKQLYNSETDYNKKEGKDNGITNKKIKEINKKLNKKIGREDGLELIHHGADDANPSSVMSENFPITFFLPEKLKQRNALIGTDESIDTYFKINSQGTIVIDDVEQLSNFQQLLINEGYRAPLNKKWSEGNLAQYFDKKRKISAVHMERVAEIQRKTSIAQIGTHAKNSNIEKILGQPIAQLDSGFDDVYLNYEKQHIMEVAAGEHSPNTNSIDHWPDPMAHYWDLKSQDAETNRKIKPTEYDYNVIIQLENDAVIKRVVANAFSKHPDDSMVIQYDIQTKQWKVLHGDLDRVKQGMIRYITAGHGDYKGHNQSTLYAGYTANQYADGINHLRKKLLNNKAPDKLVLIGCNLGRGGVSENFAFKATNALAEHGMYMPVTAYNRPLMNMYLGNKLIVPDPAIRESVSTKGHKFIYQYLPDAQQIRINKNSSILYFINEFRRGELKLNQLNSYSEPDVFYAFRDPNTRNLDLDLLKKVTYNPEAYKLFITELKKYGGVLPDSFYHDFSKKLNQQGMTSIPLWKMVDNTRIQKLSSSTSAVEHANLTIIIRLVDDGKGRQLAESWAAKKPDHTLIFQMDAEAKTWMVEYGETSISSLVESQKTVNWVLLGDAATLRKSNTDLVSGLLAVKQKYPFAAPKHILYHSLSHGMITESGEHRNFTSELEVSLKQHGFVTSVSSKFTHELALSTTKAQQTQALFENVALGEQNLTDIRLADHLYLADDFTNKNGQLDTQKIKTFIYDPLLNIEFNRYLNDTEKSVENADKLLSLPRRHSQQAENIYTLLSAIKDDLLVLNHLSPKSKALIKELFPAGDGIDNGKILDIVTDNNKFSLLSEKLTGFSQLGAHNFEGENAALKNLTFSEAFKLYDEGHSQRLQQYNQLMNQQKMRGIDYQIGLVNHGVVRSKHQSHTHDQLLGTIYAIEYSLTDVHTARDMIERQAQLEEANSKNTLSPAEEKLLIEIRKYGQSLHDIISHEGIAVADQSISHLFSDQGEIKNGITFLKGKKAVYTAIYREHNGVYEYCLFDPQGIQFSVKHENRQSAKQQFQQQVERYFSEEIQLADGQKISRGKAAGFSEIEGGGFRADIQSIDLDASQVKTSLTESLNARRLIHQNEVFPAPKNCWIKFGDEKISFAKLQQLGATIDGKPLSMVDIAMDNLHKRIRFSPEKLTNYFTLMEGSQNDLTFIKIFNDQINSNNIYQLVENEGTFAETAVLKKQLRYLANGVDLQQDKIPDVVLKKMQQAGIKLPRYQRIANRFGQGMGAAGAIQTLISANAILNQLDNPDLTKEEIKELEKQFYLLCASAFFNYGDMVLQPMLLNIASAKGATSLFKARLAMGAVVVFNLVGMGLDAYQAYDSLSKLDSVTDPKQRQDLIVNASFSIASCIVSGVVIVGILVGASTIPVVGLAIGGVLIVGGWIYSGVRAVENIKEVIDIDWDRELEEGIRGALGIEPTLRTQQEINAKLYIDAFKQQDWNMDLAQFEQQLLPAGFDQHFSIIEKPTQQSETRFYLVDGHGNYFYGALSSRKPIHSRAYFFFSKKNAPSFTEEDANFILENKSYRKGAWHKNLPRIYRSLGLEMRRDFSIKKEVKEVNDYVRVGSEPTNEMYFLNPNYQNPLLERFKTRFKIPNVYTQSSIEKQLMVSSPEQISLFSRQNRYEAFKPETDQKSSKGEQYINDRYRIAWYLEDKNSAGTSWNTANGNDVVIGYAEQKNAFQVLSGEKYFAGGNHDDLFYIRDGSLASLQANGGNLPTKYLDGQAGVDTVIVDSLPKDHHVYAHLAGNTLSYKQEGNKPFIPVAHLQGVENVIVKGNTNDSLRGNDDDNILDGGFGKDLLIGEGGNDKLILTQGTAIGGEGNDRYHVRRYQWFEAVDALYSSERYWEQSEKKVKTRRYLNPVYQEIARKFEANVVIEETSQSQSTVSLEYSLNEIKRVFVDGNDLHLVINLPSSKIDGITYENIESTATIELKNAVREHNGQNNIHHQYRVQTQDGFVMETRFEEERPNQYFTIRYIESLEQTEVPESNVVKINEELNTISVGEKRHYTAPDWGCFTHVGGAKQLEYRGNSLNNMLPFLQAGSHIQVSRGVDTYQIVQSKTDDSEIVFDFSAVNLQYTDKDKVILLLPNENGYLLTMNGSKLQRIDQQGKVHLNIHFTQVGSELEDVVLIQDKNSNLFTVNVKTQTLSPLNPVAESTDDSDAIILPVGYQSALPVINGKQGDDIIMDRSGYGHVLVGGEGDDKVVASDGENVLISLAGEDYLSGGKGDDLYIVSGHGDGDVIISDMEGKNQVMLINFESHSVTHHKISDDLAETRYQSESGRKVTVQHNNLLQSEDNVMTFKHLNSKQSLAKVNVESTVDQLVQSLAQQRVNYEANFEPLDDNPNSRYQWGAVQATERFFNQLT
ncbi:TPA: RTX toxin [Providencia alcalifaciens]|nr:RTX toxin [Providencia alcalifaciens]